MKVLMVFILMLTVSCGSGGENKPAEKETLLGAPPTAKDDPFFFVAMPAAAERVQEQGTIGSANAENNPTVAPTGEGVQCFSCVRICAKDGDCDGAEDLICGWGVHPVQEVSMIRATAECDGALNLARYAPQWAEIEGECPIAQCK